LRSLVFFISKTEAELPKIASEHQKRQPAALLERLAKNIEWMEGSGCRCYNRRREIG
jgi:hypothetical protein